MQRSKYIKEKIFFLHPKVLQIDVLFLYKNQIDRIWKYCCIGFNLGSISPFFSGKTSSFVFAEAQQVSPSHYHDSHSGLMNSLHLHAMCKAYQQILKLLFQLEVSSTKVPIFMTVNYDEMIILYFFFTECISGETIESWSNCQLGSLVIAHCHIHNRLFFYHFFPQ